MRMNRLAKRIGGLTAAAFFCAAALLYGCALRGRHTETDDVPDGFGRQTPALVLEANGKRLYAVPEDNAAAAAFVEQLSGEPLTLLLRDRGGVEKAGPLPWELPADGRCGTAAPGDVILCEDNQIAVCYGGNTSGFTKLASAQSATEEELLQMLGSKDATVRFWVEWPE